MHSWFCIFARNSATSKAEVPSRLRLPEPKAAGPDTATWMQEIIRTRWSTSPRLSGGNKSVLVESASSRLSMLLVQMSWPKHGDITRHYRWLRPKKYSRLTSSARDITMSCPSEAPSAHLADSSAKCGRCLQDGFSTTGLWRG